MALILKLLIILLNFYLHYQKRQKSKNFQNIGGFGSITEIDRKTKNPQLVACTDGVGTKIELANN